MFILKTVHTKNNDVTRPLIVLAPMSGVTDRPFRDIVRKYGQPDHVVSEMIASQAMVRHIKKSLRRTCQEDEEKGVIVQLAGCDPDVMAQATRLVLDMGAQAIDINMGCPAKKIAINSYAGSALMRDEALAGRIFEAVTRASTMPVTVKMRKGWDDHSLNAPALAKIAQAHGLTGIAVHGRTRCQFYQGNADWLFIKEVVNSVSIPVLGNGDIVSQENAQTMLDVSGAAGVMIGRGCYGRPWFLHQVRVFLETGEKVGPPPIETQQRIVEEHMEGILKHYGMVLGVGFMRKHLGWYSKGFAGASEFRVKVCQEEDPACIKQHIKEFYGRLASVME